MSLFDFFKKKDNRAEKLRALEKLLSQTSRWKYSGIHHTYLDMEYGPAFLADITLDKSRSISQDELRRLGQTLRKENRTYSRAEIEALSRQAGFDAWEAFNWKKEYAETIRYISSLSLPT